MGTALFTEFHSELGTDFESLDELLRGISAVGEITPRTTDHVAAFGEMLSSKIVAAAFSAQDVYKRQVCGSYSGAGGSMPRSENLAR